MNKNKEIETLYDEINNADVCIVELPLSTRITKVIARIYDAEHNLFKLDYLR
jgi:hypothetical protein